MNEYHISVSRCIAHTYHHSYEVQNIYNKVKKSSKKVQEKIKFVKVTSRTMWEITVTAV